MLFRSLDSKGQAAEVSKVKRFESGVLKDPITIPPTLSVREVRASVGAGFVYPICGDMRTMPGLSKEPAAAIIDILENGDIINLS